MIAFLLGLVWLAGIAALLSRRWIRRQRDAWPIVGLWPVALAFVIAILLYEGCFKFVLALRHLARLRRWNRR